MPFGHDYVHSHTHTHINKHKYIVFHLFISCLSVQIFSFIERVVAVHALLSTFPSRIRYAPFPAAPDFHNHLFRIDSKANAWWRPCRRGSIAKSKLQDLIFFLSQYGLAFSCLLNRTARLTSRLLLILHFLLVLSSIENRFINQFSFANEV